MKLHRLKDTNQLARLWAGCAAVVVIFLLGRATGPGCDVEPSLLFPSSSGGSSAASTSAIRRKLKYPKLPDSCTKVVLDVGTNNGKDLLKFLKLGYCVIGVDANPVMVERATQRVKEAGYWDPDKVRIVEAGVSDQQSNEPLPFYLTKNKAKSSFDKVKAGYPKGVEQTIYVPVIPCESLFDLIPDGVRPFYMKVDIEELHYVCIQSLERVKEEQLPTYISWEMHEYAMGYPIIILDTKLILSSFDLGYDVMKVGGNTRADSSGALPQDAMDFYNQNKDWYPVNKAIMRGIENGRTYKGQWFDYYMKNTKIAESEESEEE